MLDIINSWQFNLAMFYILVVIYFQYYKIAVVQTKSDATATIFLQLLGSSGMLLLIPFFPFTLPANKSLLILLLLATVFYAITDRLNTTVRKNLEVSTFSIVNQVNTVFIIGYGYIVFNEPFILTKTIGALLIIGANAWLFYVTRNKKATKRESKAKYFFLALFSAFAFATAITIDIGISSEFNLPLYIVTTLSIPALILMVSERVSPKSIASEWRKANKKYYYIAGLSWGFMIFFSLRSLQFGDVNTVVPLQAAAVILNVIAAFAFQGERSNPYKKLIAALIVVLGVYLTVL